MAAPTVLVSTWGDGLLVVTGGAQRRELATRPCRGLTADGRGGALCIVDGHSLCRRAPDGTYTTLATSESELACCKTVGDVVYVGTDDARLLRLTSEGRLAALPGFDVVPGRETWYAGSAVIDGRFVGPPLGVRSLTATSDGAALLVNVHVGGLPRSADGGATWQPTIEIDHDVHDVCAHPTRPRLVAAAAAAGLCLSRDGGATWAVERDGLHASYCSAVAFVGNDVVVAASTGHFATEGALYRRATDREGLTPVENGLPRWTSGIVDTAGIAVKGSAAAVVDRGGHLYLSTDDGRTWTHAADGLPPASSVLVC
jgi:hypothetical protein